MSEHRAKSERSVRAAAICVRLPAAGLPVVNATPPVFGATRSEQLVMGVDL